MNTPKAPIRIHSWGWGLFLLLYALYLTYLFATVHSLPAVVASHFAAAGQADGWMSRPAYLGFTALLPPSLALLFHFAGSLVGILPNRFVNLPRRDFWLTPEHRPRAVALVRGYLLAFTCLLLLFFATLHALTLVANAAHPPQLPLVPFFLITGGFVASTLTWTVLLLVRFRRTAL